jgi:hypothetical protein
MLLIKAAKWARQVDSMTRTWTRRETVWKSVLLYLSIG